MRVVPHRLREFGEYLKGIGASPLPPVDVPEERAPDMYMATHSSPATEMVRVPISAFPNTPSLFRFFVDGVQRTVPVTEVPVGNVRVPVHITHLVAGAMERVEGRLRPVLKREAVILLLPLQALQVATSSVSPVTRPPGQELGAGVCIYEAIRSGGSQYYSDTSVGLELQRGGRVTPLLQAGDLVRTGEVRSKALNRAKVLLRILEIGVLWELRQQYPDDWVLLDGPVAPPLKYGRLVHPSLQGLEGIARPDVAFDFLRRVIGAVKRVQIVPQSGLEFALAHGPDFVSCVYLFSDVIQEDDQVAKEILSAFLWLRRELADEIPSVWSSISGLARFDIPIPAVIDDPALKNTWNTLNEQDLANLLSNPASREHQRLRELLESIVTERWPVPSSDSLRTLTELFPIAETEFWLSAHLYDLYELRQTVFG
ncbi:hypothetical protein [Desulfovirgula thermocuniculi]|uniref:hypothetical protein n=1 Tax=Desulfovirgula thermocuniculi TaxID=348842 RepID=UPI0012EBE25B|nr:hypothetical protein [Desulfovirgula thermocuniculi]